eukprot:s1143_g5.t2
MTFGTLLPPVSLTTGLNVHGLLDLLEDLDTDSAGNLARRLLRGLERVREEQRAVLCIPLVQAYVDRLTQACSGTGNDTQPGPWTGGQTVDEPETDDQSVFVVFLILAVVLVLASTLAVSAWAKARRARLKVVADSEEEHKVAQSPDVDRVLAHVACAFAPSDVEDDKVFRESCLDLSEGDIVEVIAGGGGWFYGRVISGSGDITRMGYFPENRVLGNCKVCWALDWHKCVIRLEPLE